MRFDEVLLRSDGPGIAEEIASLRVPGRYVIDGAHQLNDSHWQFRLDVDEVRQTWTLERSDGLNSSYSDGVVQFDGLAEDHAVEFARSTIVGVVRMAFPEQLVWWGRGPESFSPVLVQHVGTRSILVTFEHQLDPAFRTTLVVDELDGIGRRQMDLGAATFVTGVRRATADEVLPPARFEPLTDWIRPTY